jgi:hypothetical protein
MSASGKYEGEKWEDEREELTDGRRKNKVRKGKT